MKIALGVFRLSGRHGGPTILLVVSVFLFIAVLAFKSSGQSTQRLMAQDDQEECHPWQYRDRNGICQDKPHVIHHHGDYDPQLGEECWVECLCQEGLAPGGNGCSPCSYVGTVCIAH